MAILLSSYMLPIYISFIVMAIFEGWYLHRTGKPYQLKDAICSFAVGFGSILSKLASSALIALIATYFYSYRLWDIPFDGPMRWFLLFIGLEFFYYWFHRTAHEVRWFWTAHAVHHSSNVMHLPAAFRLGWFGMLTGQLYFFVPLMILGFAPKEIFVMLSLNLTYQYWLHTDLIPKLPRVIEWIFNTPAHHRLHHASNPEYLDRNHGGTLIIFDRIFGTFAELKEDVPIVYGKVQPVNSRNPLFIAFHEWIALGKDIRTYGSKALIGLLLRPPGWAPDGRSNTSDDLRRRLQEKAEETRNAAGGQVEKDQAS